MSYGTKTLVTCLAFAAVATCGVESGPDAAPARNKTKAHGKSTSRFNTGKRSPHAAAPFRIVVHRQSTKDGLVTGTMSVNGRSIGVSYENARSKIPAGSYRGRLRTTSMHNFVQGPGGQLGRTGDFLVEVVGVPGRTDILIHAGNKPAHSAGCIMGGPATKDRLGVPHAPSTLRNLRLMFFDGTDRPARTPDKNITVEVVDG